MRRSHIVRVQLVLCGLLAASVLMAGCQRGGSIQPSEGNPAAEAPTEFIVYTSSQFECAAQFPVRSGEDTSAWGAPEGSSLHLDSFNPPPGYDPTAQGIAVPRTVLRVNRPEDGPRKLGLKDVYEESQLRDMLSSDVKSELSPLLMQDVGDMDPPVEFATRNGHPSATAIFPLKNSEGTIWCYVTVVYQDDGDTYSLAGLRETKEEAIVAEASFRLLDAPEASKPSKSKNAQLPDGAVKWTEAGSHVGETVSIYGPVRGSKYASTSNGEPTFIDIGAPYPDSSRVSIVVWGEHRGNFSGSPEDMYIGRTICVTGVVYEHKGVCNVEVQVPSQIRVVEK